ncbi:MULTISPECIES: WhiB family transcriptional regulator [unclassified Streptomyces]|uniref:WhiB family transcriptional regulator n=1 Tax=unclassified Streptomyces TaxID=2593676 RepID=UPI002035332A|nr:MULTISPECIES: WhiB family transcriptional regulator [unclassified Streptomyces]
MRRPVLQAAIDVGARCTQADPDLFFRADGEPPATWQAQRAEAIRFCHGCPVRAACEELALRDGDGNDRVDDLVRGGRSGSELVELRERQAQRLGAAIAADEASDMQWKQLTGLVVELKREAGKTPTRSSGMPRQTELQELQNQRIRKLVAQINAIRTARRASTGWEVAA